MRVDNDFLNADFLYAATPAASYSRYSHWVSAYDTQWLYDSSLVNYRVGLHFMVALATLTP